MKSRRQPFQGLDLLPWGGGSPHLCMFQKKKITLLGLCYNILLWDSLFLHDEYVLFSFAKKNSDWPIAGQEEIEQKRQTRRILEKGRAESESHWQTQRGICECCIWNRYMTEHK